MDRFYFGPRDHRRKGIGSTLIHEIINWGKSRGANKITGTFHPEPNSNPVAAQEMYKKFGISILEDNELIGDI